MKATHTIAFLSSSITCLALNHSPQELLKIPPLAAVKDRRQFLQAAAAASLLIPSVSHSAEEELNLEASDPHEIFEARMLLEDSYDAPTLSKQNTLAKALEPFVCGGTASAFASIIIHPIDLAKVRLQIQGKSHEGKTPSFTTVLSDLVREEGIPGAYRGVDAAVLRQLLYGTARIGLHRTVSGYLVERNGGAPISFLQKTLSGMISGSIAVCLGQPLDIALVRLQADATAPLSERRNYTGVLDALSRTAEEEGVGALYNGLGPNVCRGVSNTVGLLACYDQAKEVVASALGDSMVNGPSLPTKLGASAIAGFTQALFSMPFDLIKTRLMAQKPGEDGEVPYTGVVDCGVKVWKGEGVGGFFSGFGAYYGRCAPNAMIGLTAVESITDVYRKVFYG